MTVLLLYINCFVLSGNLMLPLQLFWLFTAVWHILLPMCWIVGQWILLWIINLSLYTYLLVLVEFLEQTTKRRYVTQTLLLPFIVVKACWLICCIFLCHCMWIAGKCWCMNLRVILVTVTHNVLLGAVVLMQGSGLLKLIQLLQNRKLHTVLQVRPISWFHILNNHSSLITVKAWWAPSVIVATDT